MYYGWITSVQYNKRYTGKFLQVQERTRPTKNKNKLERKIRRRWNLHVKKLSRQLSIDKNGISVWYNASTWMQDESRLKVQVKHRRSGYSCELATRLVIERRSTCQRLPCVDRKLHDNRTDVVRRSNRSRIELKSNVVVTTAIFTVIFVCACTSACF